LIARAIGMSPTPHTDQQMGDGHEEQMKDHHRQTEVVRIWRPDNTLNGTPEIQVA